MRALFWGTCYLFCSLFGLDACAADPGRKNFCRDYYPRLSLDDCAELVDIEDNYSRYSQKYKAIAVKRLKQINQNSLDLKDRAKALLSELDSSYFGDIPIGLMDTVIAQFKTFDSLSEDIKIELLSDRILLQDDAAVGRGDLSASAVEYKQSKASIFSSYKIKADPSKVVGSTK